MGEPASEMVKPTYSSQMPAQDTRASHRPRLVHMSEAAELLEAQYPGRLMFKITVDCMGADNCKIVREYMKSKKFEIKQERTRNGDHYGIRRFHDYGQAFNTMMTMYRKFSKGKSPKINNAHMGLELA